MNKRDKELWNEAMKFADVNPFQNDVLKFADLIRADEREKVVKFIQDYPRWLGDNAIREIIEAIRARGNT